MSNISSIHPGVRIGHVHLKVSDLEQALAFYCGVLGFELTQRFGGDAAFISAGGYHHHIGLNTWESQGGPPPPPGPPMLGRPAPRSLPAAALAALVGLAAAVAVVRPPATPRPDPGSPADDPPVGRVVAKQEVTAALLRGDLTLAEAAARFRDLNVGDALSVVVSRALHPGAGDEELAYRQALQFAASDHRLTPAQRAARLPALVAEFRARFPAAVGPDWVAGASAP